MAEEFDSSNVKIENKPSMIHNEQSNTNNTSNETVVSNEVSSNHSIVNLSEEYNQYSSPPPNYTTSLTNSYILPISTPNLSEFTTNATSFTPNQNHTLLPEISINDIENGQPQASWPFMKKYYIFGFCFFPLWYIGFFYIFSKKSDVKFWAILSTINAILISIFISYIVFLGLHTK
ncbi:hypothetical protein C1645_823050 [Glomus cerebriforme]|uniref:Uncharacterized protein n=1 Tax=Glomus cerebriforme TaxID=658196 RepID=A0A397T337_9GLOM|nr:hypothetical protein C1645_823050 [Glomus cerebriforme]